MPIDTKELGAAAADAYNGLLSNSGYVRSGEFIRHFQTFARSEFERTGLPPPPLSAKLKFEFQAETAVLGAYFPKELDISLVGDASGPLLGVSFKCMMSGIAKNVNNRWEELVGDASNLHSRFPMLALGYVMILPFVAGRHGEDKKEERLIDEHGEPTPLARQIEGKLRAITGRRKTVELPGTYEEVALAVIDFEKKQPKLHPTFPRAELRIETFFENLGSLFRERNHYLP